MLNRDIYRTAPQENRLVNNGVAEVSEDASDAALGILRYELETFVCDGQYAKGLDLILDKFLTNLDRKAEQPGVWISGFFGSGKSHLAKMLRALWTDQRFADGASARSLARLPEDILAKLKELSVQGRRHGGLHAAAGKLGAGAADKVRLALLGILFKSRGLPEAWHQAQFVLWLKQEGLLEPVEMQLAQAGRSLAQELPHLYVSDRLARALLDARPGFAHSAAEARQLLKAQFPQVSDVSSTQMTAAIDAALRQPAGFPLSLVVLDEVQQYIGNDAERAFQVQEVTETLSKHFEGRLLFVSTGQSALAGTPTLTKLIGRFPIQVTLGDWDVENVTRQIILAKQPSAQPAVEQVWRNNLGEISRHLRGTKLEHVTDDEQVLTADYPLLPVRRRLWERVLRSIDVTGTVSQLRSQLRVVHEAVLATAEAPLGHVVSGDFLYDQLAPNLVSTAQLPREVYDNVQRFAAGDAEARLKARLLKLIYLINKLPSDAAHDLGLKATEDALADLLVTNLAAGSAELRKAIPARLEELQNHDRLVMALTGSNGTEYRLQTRESSTWYDEFRAQEAQLRAAPQQVEQKRAERLKARFAEVLRRVRVTQGKGNEARELSITWDDSLPKDHDRRLYLWVQDGWQSEEKSVIAEARRRDPANPTLFVFIPALQKTELANALIAAEAARATLQRRGTPSTEEGRDAARSMESRQLAAEKELTQLLERLMGQVRVFQAGGNEVSEGSDLAERISHAARASAIRLYGQFDLADHEGWSRALTAARDGNTEALKAVGYGREVEQHPVCQKLLTFIGGVGKKGAEIREHFEAPPYGWREAIDAALYLLLLTGHLNATDASGRPVDARSLDRNKLTQLQFRRESAHITSVQRIRIRGLYTALGLSCAPNEELAKLPVLLTLLKQLAAAAGGPAPAPEPPKPGLDAIEAQTGNAQLLALHEQLEALKASAEAWKQTAARIAQRRPTWERLVELLRHARALEPYERLQAEVRAIETQRSLLADPDPVRPLHDQLVDLLRQALNAKLSAYREAHATHLAALEADADWRRLGDAQRSELAARYQLGPPPSIELASAEQLQDALDGCDLEHWVAKIQALPSRFDTARHAAVQLSKPNVTHVALPKRTLNDAAELQAWLAEVEALLGERLKQGPVAL